MVSFLLTEIEFYNYIENAAGQGFRAVTDMLVEMEMFFLLQLSVSDTIHGNNSEL